MIDEIGAGFVQYIVGDPVRTGLFLTLAAVVRMWQAERAENKRLQKGMEDRLAVFEKEQAEMLAELRRKNMGD